MNTNKAIILEVGRPPQLVGPWSVGEIRRAAEFLAQWLDAQRIIPEQHENGASGPGDAGIPAPDLP